MARGGTSYTALAKALGDERSVPDVTFIGLLSGRLDADVRKVLDELAQEIDLERALRTTLDGGGRGFYAQIGGPFELYAIARLLRPGHIVEAGVSSGISSAHFLRALKRNRRGRLHSIDLPTFQAGEKFDAKDSPVALPPGRSSGWAVPAAWRRGWDLRVGPSQKLLPPLVRELPRIDVFLHDDLHTPAHLWFELTTIEPKLRPGSVVLADNTSWTGRSLDRFAERFGTWPIRKKGTDLAGFRVNELPGGRRARRA